MPYQEVLPAEAGPPHIRRAGSPVVWRPGTQSILRYWTPVLTGVTAFLFLAGCATVPYTNRRQFNIVSDSEEQQLGVQAFSDVKTKNKISSDGATSAIVTRVGKRIEIGRASCRERV